MIFNIILLVSAFFGYIRSIEQESKCAVYSEQWSKWEREYWMVRHLPQNNSLKLSWIADGKVETKGDRSAKN